MPTVQDVLLGDFDMTQASKPVQWATASAFCQYLSEKNLIEDHEVEHVVRFLQELDPLPRMRVWASFQVSIQNLFKIHPFIAKLMIATAKAKSTADAESEAKLLDAYMHTKSVEERDSLLRKYGYLT